VVTVNNSWERGPGESPVAFAGFAAYRDLGAGRSLAKAAAKVSRSVRLLERWSAEHQWVVRAQAWDAEQDRLWLAEVADGQRQAARRHIALARRVQARAFERLQAMSEGDLAKVPADRLVYMLEVAAKMERSALGEPMKVEVTGAGGGPVEHAEQMTPEERQARLDELEREIRRRLVASPAAAGE
jgi:hypothetical protein